VTDDFKPIDVPVEVVGTLGQPSARCLLACGCEVVAQPGRTTCSCGRTVVIWEGGMLWAEGAPDHEEGMGDAG
jgi:hypothetical protein